MSDFWIIVILIVVLIGFHFAITDHHIRETVKQYSKDDKRDE